MKTIRYAMLGLALVTTAADATTVRIHYDAVSQGLSVRGDKGPMTWSQGPAAERGVDGVWTYTWPDELGEVQMKPALGERVSIGGVYRIKAGSTVDIYPFFGAPFGKVSIVEGFESPQLNNKRALRIYLPPSYQENKRKRYPVLYMHDGQNLFDAKTAAFGVEWGVDETINRLIAAGKMDEIIVVGIDNTQDRIPEYTPCCDPKYGGGRLDAYRKFIVDTVKPYVDRSYRTLPRREHSAIMGSSLGGIASVYIAQKEPHIFSKAGGVSSSFWWNRGILTQAPPRVPVKFYIDAGTRDDGLPDTTRMRDALLGAGYTDGTDLYFHAADGGSHNETSWAARVELPLTWFFPWSGLAH